MILNLFKKKGAPLESTLTEKQAPATPIEAASANYEAELATITTRIREGLLPLFNNYQIKTDSLEAALKWKPIVLIIGNYSSGKSTLVNELLEREIQRTGQAPTDDSFTIITAPPANEAEETLPGSAVVNNEALPFTLFKDYGEPMTARLQLKYIAVPFLENLALIDTPGMLDSVTEKGRGYDYAQVIADIASLSDLIVLMFDPHKAGTIKETYTSIRETLPKVVSEDRIIFVMNRIDECEDPADLVRAYGALCWNLSQMTGRKDIPRIYLTFSKKAALRTADLNSWIDEHHLLKKEIANAPRQKINNMLGRLDKKITTLKMTIEAMMTFQQGLRRLLKKTCTVSAFIGVVGFFFADLLLQRVALFPEETLVQALLEGTITTDHFFIPALGLVVPLFAGGLCFVKWLLPQYFKHARNNCTQLINSDTPYRQGLAPKTEQSLSLILANPHVGALTAPHKKALKNLERFIEQDVKSFYGG
ncbi:MAG: dynamin family protein [Deltaproteobacteria bacterium]|nr:dynamin family protein [Deltaproteobacteria bacterium]